MTCKRCGAPMVRYSADDRYCVLCIRDLAARPTSTRVGTVQSPFTRRALGLERDAYGKALPLPAKDTTAY